MRERERKNPEKLVHPVSGPGSRGRPVPRSRCRLTGAAAAPRLPAGWLEMEGEGGQGQPKPGGWQECERREWAGTGVTAKSPAVPRELAAFNS